MPKRKILTRRKVRLVDQVSPDVMDGDTRLERELNAYLTRSFIGGRDIPADECLPEARDIIDLFKSGESLALPDYLYRGFGVCVTLFGPRKVFEPSDDWVERLVDIVDHIENMFKV